MELSITRISNLAYGQEKMADFKKSLDKWPKGF
jgi:hypothetical protein